jgi:hypothetical protein
MVSAMGGRLVVEEASAARGGQAGAPRDTSTW